MRNVIFIVSLLGCCGVLQSQEIVAQEVADATSTTDRITDSIVFRATFDDSTTAEMGAGDHRIYTAESLERKKTTVGLNTEAVRREVSDDKHRGVLHFVSQTKELVYFQGGKNLPYRESNFEGTVSLWMKLSPKEDLPKGYVDPLQITDKKWNDASMFIDFDAAEERPFRLGFFSDYKFWNPDDTKFESIPAKERPMVSVSDWPFKKDRWTHVAFTWRHVNTDDAAEVTLYLDGELQGKLNAKQRFTWVPEKAVIMLGINYVGWMDDLVIFDRSLSPSDIQKVRAELE